MATDTTTTDSVSANDQLVDLYVERAIDLLRLEAGTRNKVLALLNDLEGELVAALAKIDPTAVDAISAQRNRLDKLLKSVRSATRASYRDASTLMANEIRDIADQEATWVGDSINQVAKIDLVTEGVTSQFLETIVSDVLIQGASSKDWWSRQAQGLQEKFADEMRRGMALGESNADLIARVKGKAGQAGIMDVSRNSAERLVRASVQAAANTARVDMYQKNDDLITSLQWHATLDTRTSIWCITRDGHQYSNTSDHFPKDGGPPWMEGPGMLHWGCRSTSIPVLKSWKDLGIDAEEVPQTTRATMDGQKPASLNFEQWLKKQSAARQNTVLGATAADLWRQGKIGFRDLLDQSGRPLTTEQLRAKARK